MTMVDDGERVGMLMELMGRAFVTALHAVDRAGKLSQDSELRDLGLVMTTYLEWSKELGDFDFEEMTFPWRQYVVLYAQKAGIDLKTAGCNSTKKVVEDIENEMEDGVEVLGPVNKADRWDWKKTLKEYTQRHGIRNKIGGQQYDITKMSAAERKASHFDGKDPLKGVPKEVLKENWLDFR